MMTRMLLLFSLMMSSGFSALEGGSQTGQDCSSCSLVERALKDSRSLKPGMTRKEIEAHNFTEAGGMVVRERTAYTYKNCQYIRLEVDFNLDPKMEQGISPKDVSTGFSKLTLDHPTMD